MYVQFINMLQSNILAKSYISFHLQMSGPIYSFVRLFLATLYPAYYSFKAVKTKNVKE